MSGHFVDINKMGELGNGSQREIDDITLTRHAILFRCSKWRLRQI
jgi:hypothetical protein